MRIEVDEDWYEAGRFDATKGLMPMASWQRSPAEIHAYLLGYKAVGKLGIEINAYSDAKRPLLGGDEGGSR